MQKIIMVQIFGIFLVQLWFDIFTYQTITKPKIQVQKGKKVRFLVYLWFDRLFFPYHEICLSGSSELIITYICVTDRKLKTSLLLSSIDPLDYWKFSQRG